MEERGEENGLVAHDFYLFFLFFDAQVLFGGTHLDCPGTKVLVEPFDAPSAERGSVRRDWARVDPIEVWGNFPIGVDLGDSDVVSWTGPLVIRELQGQFLALSDGDAGVLASPGVLVGDMDGLHDPDSVGYFPIKCFEFLSLQCLAVG